jgi:hypothetical protein
VAGPGSGPRRPAHRPRAPLARARLSPRPEKSPRPNKSPQPRKSTGPAAMPGTQAMRITAAAPGPCRPPE